MNSVCSLEYNNFHIFQLVSQELHLGMHSFQMFLSAQINEPCKPTFHSSSSGI